MKPVFNQALLPLTGSSAWLLMLAVAFVMPANAMAQSRSAELPGTHPNYDGPYFTTPPAPEKLAAILYPPRYRSAQPTLNGAARVADKPDLFSMSIHFAFDSTRILPESLALLDSVGQMMNLPQVRHEGLVIEGHTDASGTERYNARLAQRRAQAIKEYLANSFDIDGARMVTVSFGQTRLADPDNPLHPRNRRAAFRPMRSVHFR